MLSSAFVSYNTNPRPFGLAQRFGFLKSVLINTPDLTIPCFLHQSSTGLLNFPGDLFDFNLGQCRRRRTLKSALRASLSDYSRFSTDP